MEIQEGWNDAKVKSTNDIKLYITIIDYCINNILTACRFVFLGT